MWTKSLQTYSYWHLTKKRYRLDKEVVINSLDGQLELMRVVSEQLWVAGVVTGLNSDSTFFMIYVYSRQGKFVKNFKLNFAVTCMIEAEDGEIFAASGNSVNIIDEEGNIIVEILSSIGGYLSFDRGLLFLLVYSGKIAEMFTLQKRNEIWTIQSTLVLNVTKVARSQGFGTLDGRLIVINKTIYIEEPKCLLTFNMTGKQQHTQYGCKSIGKLFAVDREGTALFSHSKEYGLWPQSGMPATISLDHKKVYPQDVIIDPDDNGIWVAGGRKLWKFIPK